MNEQTIIVKVKHTGNGFAQSNAIVKAVIRALDTLVVTQELRRQKATAIHISTPDGMTSCEVDITE